MSSSLPGPYSTPSSTPTVAAVGTSRTVHRLLAARHSVWHRSWPAYGAGWAYRRDGQRRARRAVRARQAARHLPAGLKPRTPAHGAAVARGRPRRTEIG